MPISYMLGHVNMFASGILQGVNLCLKYGTFQGAFIYTGYAMILNALGTKANKHKAFEFSKLAFAIIEKYHDIETKGRALFIHAAMIAHWNEYWHEFKFH